ncbi:methyltransferase domain-containing protein [Streptomyces sp. TRM43335]|uniref:Methyltransferase domain-containing protein n=1 Tax=Streptomyces taklimakanensis TaxID=2569853 RepID=A0A6G2BIV3_9ACTN|nr:daptide-type RiPP biosynthesis methyltransferase [Streptomyces taklimakanensis]MTE21822.1 methyltransferase domain-containing protein [Streptomyces taklimakanensis]
MTARTVDGAPRAVPGEAGRTLARLGDRVVLCDVYGEFGAPVYDDLCRHDTFEVRELVTLVRRTRGPVLELAAGSGRLTMPLLAAGREVTALELSAPMLELLAARLAEAPARLRERCTPVRADMSDFCLGRTFGSVVLGTTSVSLLDEDGRAGLYRSVRAHLAPGGTFLLSTVDMASGADTPTETRIDGVGAGGRAYHLHEFWDPAAGTRTVTILPADPGGPDEGPVYAAVSTVAVLPARRLTDELSEAGFRVRDRHVLPTTGGRHEDVLLEAEVAR